MTNTAHRSKRPAPKRPIWNGSDRKDAPQSIAHAAIGQHPGTPTRSSNHNSP
jgi:hypothetical protein